MMRCRMILVTLVLAWALGVPGVMAPSLMPFVVSPAFADDDDDGGGRGGGGATGGGGWSGRGGGSGAAATRIRPPQFRAPWVRQRVNAPRRAERRTRARPARAVAAPVVATPRQGREYLAWRADAASAPITLPDGYQLVDRDRIASLDAELLRIRAPAGRGDRRARAELGAALPGADISRNVNYALKYRLSGRTARGRAIGYTPAPRLACTQGARLALIDTAVDAEHPALIDAPIGRMTVRGAERAASSAAHGTAVASALVARPDAEVPALATGAQLIAIDAFHKDAAGQDVTDAFDFARALDRVEGLKVEVLNLSVAGPDHPVVARLIEALIARGVVIVAAAGNDGPRAPPLYPAAYPGVIGVTAVHPDGAPWRGAARGPHIDVAATGVSIALAGPNGAMATFTGTSFAAPIVSAILAGETGLTDATLAVERLAMLARDIGTQGRDDRFGFGWVEPVRGCGR